MRTINLNIVEPGFSIAVTGDGTIIPSEDGGLVQNQNEQSLEQNPLNMNPNYLSSIPATNPKLYPMLQAQWGGKTNFFFHLTYEITMVYLN
jgi:hypothetical protein